MMRYRKKYYSYNNFDRTGDRTRVGLMIGAFGELSLTLYGEEYCIGFNQIGCFSYLVNLLNLNQSNWIPARVATVTLFSGELDKK